MEKHSGRLIVGRSRTKNPRIHEPRDRAEENRNSETAAHLLFCVGTVFAAAALLFPMGKEGLEKPESTTPVPPNAVLVMSGAVTEGEKPESEREELAQPEEQKTSAEEWSVFDSIGELFAELIFGKRA